MKTFATGKKIDGVMYTAETIIADDWYEAYRIAHWRGVEVVGILYESMDENGNSRVYDNDISPKSRE